MAECKLRNETLSHTYTHTHMSGKHIFMGFCVLDTVLTVIKEALKFWLRDKVVTRDVVSSAAVRCAVSFATLTPVQGAGHHLFY